MKIIYMLLTCLTSLKLMAGTLTGTVYDQKKQVLPYATLHIKGTSIGTAANSNGNFILEVPEGKHILVVQFVGYKTRQVVVEVGKDSYQMEVELKPEILKLQEVTIDGSGQDPAYDIIRQVIDKRKELLEEVLSYQCNMYIKGIQRLDEKPNRLFGIDIPLDTGIVYLSESISKIEFSQPNQIKETMISSKVSGQKKGFSFNQGAIMLISFYQNKIAIPGISERAYISPVANNAFAYYDYEYLGQTKKDSLTILKIKVLAKRPHDPVFQGVMYIIEDQWRIANLYLKLTKDHQLEFVDWLSINQTFAPVGQKAWMPLSQHFEYNLNIMGFEGEGSFTGVYSNYKISLNPKYDVPKNIPTTDKNQVVKRTKRKSKRQNKSSKNELLRIAPDANKRDNGYWSMIRPIPLTQAEKIDYYKKDSISIVHSLPEVKQLKDKINNKLNIEKILYAGHVHKNSVKERAYYFRPLTNMLQYNTVEGAVIQLNSVYSKWEGDLKKFSINPVLRYGFASQNFYGKLKTQWNYDPKTFGKLKLSAGHFVNQFNSANPILPWVNSLETILLRRNFIKLYEKTFVAINHEKEIVNGIVWGQKLSYAQRNPLQNQDNFSFFYEDSRAFTSNNPSNQELANTSFTSHEALIFSTELFFTIDQKYVSHPSYKMNLGSKYPKFKLNYRKGITALGSDVDFDLIRCEVTDDLSLGLWGTIDYSIAGGGFLRNKNSYFMDYQHFSGNQSYISLFRRNDFLLLDYYQFSTTKPWLEAHYAHHFNGFIINKIPWIRKSKMQAVANINYLKTDANGHYIEFGAGIEHIFKMIRINYVKAYLNGGNYGHAIRVGLGF